MENLTKAQHRALRQMAQPHGRKYGCRTSMHQMMAMGFVEAAPDPHTGHIGVNGPWVITDAGRRALAEHEGEG